MIATSTRPMIHMPTARLMPIGRICRAYANEVKYECLRMLRAPAFSIPFLLLPVPVYLFFGVMLAGSGGREEPGRRELPVLRILGVRGHGPGAVRRRLRVGGGARGRTAQAEAGAAGAGRGLSHRQDDDGDAVRGLAMIALVAAALSREDQPLGVAAADHDHGDDVGAIPFAAIGLFIGAHASGSSAPAFANLIFLPMLWLSGLFIPLPKFLERLAVIWPAFHLNQVALGSAGVSEFSFLSPAISAAVLVGFTVIFGGLAIRRLARRG